MLRSPSRRRAALPLVALAATTAALVAPNAGATAAHHHPPRPSHRITVVANNLDNPRKLVVGEHGIYVTEAGHGGTGPCAADPEGGTACIGLTGGVTFIGLHDDGDHDGDDGGPVRQYRVIDGLASVAGADGMSAGGPSAVLPGEGGFRVLMQDTNIDATGANPFGPDGVTLGHLLSIRRSGKVKLGPDFAAFEAANNPDHGAGAQPGNEIDSDPYGVVRYRHGWAVADAAGNDLLWVSPSGKISVLAVFPIQMETAPPGVAGPGPVTLPAQSVPTSVIVGPDGALYVSELTGFPFQPGFARVWRVVPGQAPTVYASGFTNISDIKFDHHGRLLVLEIANKGLLDMTSTGALIRVNRDGSRTTLATTGLVAPTGLALGEHDEIYVSNFGIFPAAGPGPHGQVVRIS